MINEIFEVPFDASDFVGGGSMTWTVASGDVVTNQFAILMELRGPGAAVQLILWQLLVGTTDLSGTANNELRVTLPDGRKVAETVGGTCLIRENGVEKSGRYVATKGNTYVSFFQEIPTTAWTLGTGNTDVLLNDIIPVTW